MVTDDGALTEANTININVTAANDSPVNSIPSSQSVSEDADLIFSSINGNTISVSDIDSGQLTITLKAINGLLTLSGTNGLTLITGDGEAESEISFRGDAQSINQALNGLIFTPYSNFNGQASVVITTDDGNLSQDSTININVQAVNDNPIQTVPTTQTTNEDTNLIFSTATGNAISVGDIDSPVITVTLSSTNGTLTLNGNTGLTFAQNSPNLLQFTGTIGNINQALEGLSFNPNSDYNGNASIQVSTSDGFLTATNTINVIINAVNDSPILTTPPAQALSEDNILVFSSNNGNSITIQDIDNQTATLTLQSTQGALTLSSLMGLTFLEGDGNSDVRMVFTGTVNEINMALNGLLFSPTPNYNGNAAIQVEVNDGSLTSAQTINLTVNAVNDTPFITNPVTQTVNEDTSLTFSQANGNAIQVSDVDSPTLTLTLTTANGTISLGSNTNLSFLSGTGVNETSFTISGTLADLNQALEGLKFNPNQDYNGTTSLVISSDDGSLVEVKNVNIVVNAVNDIPVNQIPGVQTTQEDVALTFSQANGNAIRVGDVDSPTLTITLATSNGTLSLLDTTGVTLLTGTGFNDSMITLQGSADSINQVLNGLRFNPVADFNGTASLAITTTDGILSQTDIISINVEAVNDAPLAYLPNSQTIVEDHALIFSNQNNNALSVADSDSNTVTVSLSVNNGYLILSRVNGLSFTQGSGANDSLMTFSGTIANINSALNGLTFVPNENYNGTSQLNFSVNDSQLSQTQSIEINVQPYNDAPVNLVPGPQLVNEDSPLVFNTANGNHIQLFDIDASGNYQLTLIATHGRITLSQADGLTFLTGNGNGNSVIVLQGNLANLNQALNGLIFTPSENYSGAASISVQTQELSTAEKLFAKDTIVINVNSVADMPDAMDKNYTFISGSQLQISSEQGLLVGSSNIENSGLEALVVQKPKHGILILYTDGSFVYTPDADFVGTDVFTFKLNNGGANSEVKTVTLNILQTSATPAAPQNAVLSLDATSTPQVSIVPVDGNREAIITSTPITPSKDEMSTIGSEIHDVIATKPEHGQVWIDKGMIYYQPEINFIGLDSFTMIITSPDGKAEYINVTFDIKLTASSPSKPIIFAKGADEALAYLGNLTQGAVTFSTTTPLAAMSQMIVKHNDQKEEGTHSGQIESADSDRTVNTVAAIAITMDPSDLPEGLTTFDGENDTSSASIVIDALKQASKNKNPNA
jgi:hypothetical protein